MHPNLSRYRQLIRVPALRGTVFVKKWVGFYADPAVDGWIPYATARCDFNFAADRFFFVQNLDSSASPENYSGQWVYTPINAFYAKYPAIGGPQTLFASNFAFDYFQAWYQNYIGGARLKLVSINNDSGNDIIAKRVYGPSSTPTEYSTTFSGEGSVVSNPYVRGIIEIEAPYERQDLFSVYTGNAPAQVDYTWVKIRDKSTFLPADATGQWEKSGACLVYTAPADDFKFMCLLPPPAARPSAVCAIVQSEPNFPPSAVRVPRLTSSDEEFEQVDVPLSDSERARLSASFVAKTRLF